jgi:hypothetical protein
MLRSAVVIFLLGILFLHDMKVFGQSKDSTEARRWYVPGFVPVQYAGNIGFISTGVGYASRLRNYELALMYGYAPKSMAGAVIQTLTAKNTFPIIRYPLKNNEVLIPYLGLGVSFEIGGNAFFRMPSHFPESYYDYPKNLRFLAYGGAKVQHLFDDDFYGLRGVELFAEAGTIDLYIWYKVMSHEIRTNDIFSVAIGANFLLAE